VEKVLNAHVSTMMVRRQENGNGGTAGRKRSTGLSILGGQKRSLRPSRPPGCLHLHLALMPGAHLGRARRLAPSPHPQGNTGGGRRRHRLRDDALCAPTHSGRFPRLTLRSCEVDQACHPLSSRSITTPGDPGGACAQRIWKLTHRQPRSTRNVAASWQLQLGTDQATASSK